MTSPKISTTPLVRYITYNQFTGPAARYAAIPVGEVGLVIDGGQVGQPLQPGLQPVVNWSRTLFGHAGGVKVALMNAAPFSGFIAVEQLVPADTSQSVDLSVRLTVYISDPAQFYAAWSASEGLDSEAALLSSLLTETAERRIAQAVRQRPLAELSRPPAQAALQQTIREALEPPAREYGLTIEAVDRLTVQPAQDLARRLEQFTELTARLQQININAALDAAEQQAMMQETVQQMEQDYGLASGSLSEAVARQALDLDIDALKRQLTAEVEAWQAQWQSGTAGRYRRLQQRIGSVTPSPEPDSPASTGPVIPLKWGGYALGLILLAMALFWPNYKGDMGPRLIYAAVGLGLAALGWAIALNMDKKAARGAVRPPVNRLSPANLEQTDMLVRRQVAGELHQMGSAIQQARQRIYQQGDEALALRLGEIRRSVDRLAEQAQQPTFGRPAYLLSAVEDWAQLGQPLAYDERLLDQAAEAGQAAHKLTVTALDTPLPAELLTDIETRLVDLEQAFAARSRLNP